MNRNNRVIPLATRQKEIELLRLGENNARKSAVTSDGSISRYNIDFEFNWVYVHGS